MGASSCLVARLRNRRAGASALRNRGKLGISRCRGCSAGASVQSRSCIVRVGRRVPPFELGNARSAGALEETAKAPGRKAAPPKERQVFGSRVVRLVEALHEFFVPLLNSPPAERD